MKLSKMAIAGGFLACSLSSGLQAQDTYEDLIAAGDVQMVDKETEVAEVSLFVSGLNEALESTYLSNPRIKAQRKLFENTGEGYNQALSGWLPTLSLNYNKGRRRNRLDGDFTYFDLEDKQFNLDQPIFRGGETLYAMHQAEHNSEASAAQLISVTQEVLNQSITAYLDVVRDRLILDLSRDNEEVLKSQLASSEDRFSVGEATRTDVSQSQARLSRARSDAIQASGNVTIAEAAFERLIGSQPAKSIAYPDSFPDIPATLDEAVDIAQKSNPRIIAADFTEEAADDAVSVTKARLLPDVTLRGAVSRAEGSGFTGVNFDTDSLLLNVNVPLYQGGAQYSRVREAKTEKSRRRYELMETRNEVRQQTIQAWESYQTSNAVIDAQKDAITAAEVALDGVKQEQLYGSRTVLDVLDAEQELFVARINLMRSERNRMVSWYGLLAVLGQLSPENLGLEVVQYDQEETIDDIKHQFIGF